MKRIGALMALVFVFICGEVIGAEERKEEGVSLTVYNQDMALVKDYRFLELKERLDEIKFENVAHHIDPTSVHFNSLTYPKDCIINEQHYEYDLISVSKLLSKYIDKNIEVITKGGEIYEGILISYDDDNLILSQVGGKSGLSIVRRGENILNIRFPELPEGLITKPTLLWNMRCNKKGRHLTELSYLTNGINWKADYVAIVNDNDETIDLSGWVSIDNKSGATYRDAKLKLIAGDIRRVTEEQPVVYEKMRVAKMAEAEGIGFEEKPLFEYHLYTLKSPTTIKDDQIKQIPLLSAPNVTAKKLFIFESSGQSYRRPQQKPKVNIKLELVNSEKQGLGMPLPKGKIKVYKKDVEGDLEFIGEDLIDHTPKDKEIRLYIGDAFDIEAERKQISSRKISDRVNEESYKIELRNHKDKDVKVIVVEHFYRGDWTIIQSSHDYTKKDVSTIEFEVAVPKDGEVAVDYTVRYRW